MLDLIILALDPHHHIHLTISRGLSRTSTADAMSNSTRSLNDRSYIEGDYHPIYSTPADQAMETAV